MSNEQLVESLSSLSVLELSQLTRTLEQKWGVKAAPVTVSQPQPQQEILPQVTAPVQTEFNVVMKSFAPDKKMPVLKLTRELTGLGLKEIKDFMEALPKTVKEGVSKAEAEDMVAKLTEAGAVVSME